MKVNKQIQLVSRLYEKFTQLLNANLFLTSASNAAPELKDLHRLHNAVTAFKKIPAKEAGEQASKIAVLAKKCQQGVLPRLGFSDYSWYGLFRFVSTRIYNFFAYLFGGAQSQDPDQAALTTLSQRAEHLAPKKATLHEQASIATQSTDQTSECTAIAPIFSTNMSSQTAGVTKRRSWDTQPPAGTNCNAKPPSKHASAATIKRIDSNPNYTLEQVVGEDNHTITFYIPKILGSDQAAKLGAEKATQKTTRTSSSTGSRSRKIDAPPAGFLNQWPTKRQRQKPTVATRTASSAKTPEISGIRHTVGIAHPHPNLWTGQALDRRGNLFYLGFERVQPDNLSFWEAYARMSEVIATKYGFVISNSAKGKAHKSAPYFAQMFPSLQAYHAMSQQIARDPERYRKLKASLGDGLAGFGTTLLGMKIPKNNWQGYIVYASRTPITEPLANRHYMGMDGQPKSMAQLEETGRFACYGPQDKDFYQEYANNFGQLIMTMTSTTQPNSPSATHLGISRNPLKFVRAEREYPKISLILHGFASECEKMLGKQVQVNRPISGMQKILQQALPAGTVWTDRCPLGALEPLEHAHGGCNPLIGFDLAACAKFYQAAQPQMTKRATRSVR